MKKVKLGKTYKLFVLPILICFFAFNTLSDSGINQTATLKTYTKSNQETVVYQYDSLKEFSKNVKNWTSFYCKYCDRAKKMIL